MKPIELDGDPAAGAASIAFLPIGAITYLSDAAKGVSASYDAIQGFLVSPKVRHLFKKSKYLRIVLPPAQVIWIASTKSNKSLRTLLLGCVSTAAKLSL